MNGFQAKLVEDCMDESEKMNDEALAQARITAIKALNECHEKHGIKKIMFGDFCTSLANEMTIARHFKFAFARIEELQAVVGRLAEYYEGTDALLELKQRISYAKQHAAKEDNDKEFSNG